MKKIFTPNLLIFVLFSSIILLSASAFAQVGINNTNPDPNSLLEIGDATTNTKGLLLPRVNLTGTANIAPMAAHIQGMVVYNKNTAGDVTPGYYYNTGSLWARIGDALPDDGWKITGNANTTSGTSFLGTTNPRTLQFRTRGIQRFEISDGSNITNGGRLLAFADGQNGSPIYSWNSDTNTGMYRIGDDILGFSTNGTERFRMSASEAVFNEASINNFDFRVESNSRDNMFFVQGNTNRIGIQTTTPAYTFHVVNSGNVGGTSMGYFENGGVNGVALTTYNTSQANGFNSFEGVTDGTNAGTAGLALTTGNGGNGVFGGTNDWQSVGVLGSRFNSGGPNTGFGGLFINDLGYTGALLNVSDRRLKRDINEIDNALTVVNKLRPVSYFFDTNKYSEMGLNSSLDYGFIAQEVKAVLPTIVKEKLLPTNAARQMEANSEASQTENFLTVDYTRIIPILTKAIQEQQAIIESQNKRIEALERAIKN